MRMRYYASPANQHIAMIGGGWSGLQGMAHLHELGMHNVKGFEQYDWWGGTWHPV